MSSLPARLHSWDTILNRIAIAPQGDALMDTAEKTYFVDITALNAILEFYPAGEFPEVWDTLSDLAKEEKSESVPYVIALAAARRAGNGKTNRDYAVVANGPLSSRFELIDICEDPAYDIYFMSHPYMLREIDRSIPVRPRGIVELWGMWKDLDITEEEIEASRITFKGAVR